MLRNRYGNSGGLQRRVTTKGTWSIRQRTAVSVQDDDDDCKAHFVVDNENDDVEVTNRNRWYRFQSIVERIWTSTKSSWIKRLWNIVKVKPRYYWMYVILGGVIAVVLLGMLTMVVYWDGRNDPFGAYVDQYLMKRYYRFLLRQQQQQYHYPDVTIKATRKVEREHYSHYLYEIMSSKHFDAVTTTELNHSHRAGRSKTLSDMQQLDSNLSTTIRIDGMDELIYNKSSLNARDLRAPKNDQDSCSTIFRWICHRCLHTGYAGSYDRCQPFCWLCSVQDLFPLPKPPFKEDHPITVSWIPITTATETKDDPLPYHHRRRYRIPRIIHQAWDRYIRTYEYPELARLQNTWRSCSGYEYYFYTPKEQLRFVREFYHPTIVAIYEAIATTQEQLSFFQLLVLYKLGGIYANIDVMLEVNLDALISNGDHDDGISFIASRNPHLLQQHCVYNGFIAAEPGHPIIGTMIASVVRSAIPRALATTEGVEFPLFDDLFHVLLYGQHQLPMHLRTVHEHESLPIWKLHVAPPTAYMYGGNCAWGMSINSILHNHPLEDFEVLGKHNIPAADKNTGVHGTILILMVRNDFTFI
jgi:hypothetical protein